MQELKIRKYGDPVLRAKCKEVREITDEVRSFAKKMLKAMYEGDGIGLAAPQVGDKRRIIVVDIGQGHFSLINPKIIKKSDKIVKEFEGCLSLPGIYLRIKRHQKVEIQAYLLEREQNVIIKAEDLLARDLQHEIDHLNGILIIDKVSFIKKIKAIKKLKGLRG